MASKFCINLANQTVLAMPVERLNVVDEVVRKSTGPFESQSLPGHLLHIVISGRVRQVAEGRVESFGEGAVVWYYENEPIRGNILRAPWRFITINFHAPSLPPPDDELRVLRSAPFTLGLARNLLTLWRDRKLPTLERQLRCHLTLLELLLEIRSRARLRPAGRPNMNVWWPIEKKLRTQLADTYTLEKIQHISGFGLRTIIRACQSATGMPPMKRLKELRLGYARGLVQHSDLSITEIAFRIGYARSQEFSRDYRKRFQVTPREDRRRFPAYKHLEKPRSRGENPGRDGK
jgi:AraC-like DNA-binding protein